MRVFVFCPTRPEWPHLYGRTIHSIFRLEWDEPLECTFLRGKAPFDNAFDRVAWKYQRGREIFLRGDHDALLTIEADMTVPSHALKRLIKADADVAYGLYCLREGSHRWNAFTKVGNEHGKSVSEDPALAREAWGQVISVEGVGLGCTLIRCHVLEEVEFRPGDGTYNDWRFSLDCQERGFVQKADLGVVCGHVTAEPSPRILWPNPEAERLYSIELLGGEWVEIEKREDN